MKKKSSKFAVTIMMLFLALASQSGAKDIEVVRPEDIKSKRQVVYDDETYFRLKELWKKYYDSYPSEYAYANWMYAARYASDKDYSNLLDKGLKKYPSNPTLLYLKGIEFHGGHNNIEGRKYLEKSVALDPHYLDPWFALIVNYMDARDSEKLDIALRHVLESGIITDEILDYNYNVLLGLEKNAILITNGDNDTYPVWILTRILKMRPDVTVVNRSLLNSEWYPIYIIEQGMPRFITSEELQELRNSTFNNIKDKKSETSPGGLFGDILIFKIIESAAIAGRPAYLSKTLFITDKLKSVIVEKGRELGLVFLVTPSKSQYSEQIKAIFTTWVDSFRTGGLDSWRLANASETDSGRMLMCNYAAAIAVTMDSLKLYAPELRLRLFNWYVNHLEMVLSEQYRGVISKIWCQQSDLKDIEFWCRQKGIKP